MRRTKTGRCNEIPPTVFTFSIFSKIHAIRNNKELNSNMKYVSEISTKCFCEHFFLLENQFKKAKYGAIKSRGNLHSIVPTSSLAVHLTIIFDHSFETP